MLFFQTCRYGGVYLDSDVVVLKPLDSLNNSLGTESPVDEELSLNGAVMAFEKHRFEHFFLS